MRYCLLLFVSSTLFALPTRDSTRALYFHDPQDTFNACDPCFLWQDAIRWELGYYGNFVFNRNLERRQNVHGLGDVERVSFATNGGTLTLNIIDWVEFFTMLGTSKFSICTPARDNQVESEFFFSPRFCWSIGANGVVWKCGDLAFGFSGQYFRTMPKIDAFTDLSGGIVTSFNNIEKSTYYEWQAAFTGSYLFGFSNAFEFVPYISWTAAGAKMGMRGLTFSNNGTIHHILNMKDKKMWGYALGISGILRRKASISAEAHFADQKAFFLGADLAF